MASNKSCQHKYVEKCDIGLCCLSCGTIRNSIFTAPTPTPSIDEYQYIPLKRYPQEIRLVALYPGHGSDPICCRIITAQLRSLPYYTAASYTWATEDGDATRIHTVQVYTGFNFKIERSIKVTTNCHSALRQLRHAQDIRHVWVDAICINQGQTSERNHQVSIMDEIYRKAAIVEICICRPDYDYQGALDLLAPKSGTRKELLGLTLAELQGRPEILQLTSLFATRYFSRVWVIQEVLSAEVAVLHVNNGTVRFTEEALKILNTWFQVIHLDIPRLSHWVSIWTRNPSIISLLSMSLKCSASDPRDRVFAIASLLPSHVRALISIDYMATTHEVFRQAVMACIRECGDLEILSFAQILSEDRSPAEASFTMESFLQFLQQKERSALLCQPLALGQQMKSTHGTSTNSIRFGKHIDPETRVLLEATFQDSEYQSRTDHYSRIDHYPRIDLLSIGAVPQSRITFSTSTSQRTISVRYGSILSSLVSYGNAFEEMLTRILPVTTWKLLVGYVPPTQLLPRLEVSSILFETILDASFNPTAGQFLPYLEAIHDCDSGLAWPWLRVFCNGRTHSRRSIEPDIPSDKSDTYIIQNIFKEMSKTTEDYGAGTLRVFHTDKILGLASCSVLAGDAIFAIHGTWDYFVLREIHPGLYRVLGKCFCWTAGGVLEHSFDWKNTSSESRPSTGKITLF
jgi:hypothetical protein